MTVRNKNELKSALSSSADEIVIENQKLVKQLRAIKLLRKAGPLAIGIVIAAIPLLTFTGGVSLPATLLGFMGASALPVSSSVVGLTVAIGGIVLIGILTDWEEVEIAGVFKLRRKRKCA
ncbi:hypothetical protein [Cyanobium sp. LEGE 06113]|uniref:hypothetical protein n=1 Tax=Cyanobium sp. LEGE 06113 TaxID=1297573 RepID=UPI00188096CB|nr:hypothetical protein [Cyanobium sp. LEGE 06113]MBE9155014.1 hypothetical protein [Cyanobium sp. LEGE 06113]